MKAMMLETNIITDPTTVAPPEVVAVVVVVEVDGKVG